jgi:Uma2 family endonuclease
MTVVEQVRPRPMHLKPKRRRVDNGEQLIHLSGVSWQFYESFLDALGDRPIRLTYDRGDLEIMTLSSAHEGDKKLVGRLVETLTLELNIPLKCGGSTTFKREDLERGLEPDECYWIENEALVRDKRDIDFRKDPPPDLAVEIEISRSSINRRGIYAALGVPELWCCDGESLRVYLLQEPGVYRQSDRSRAFPFLPLDEFAKFLRPKKGMGETRLLISFRDWVRKRIRPIFKKGSKRS